MASTVYKREMHDANTQSWWLMIWSCSKEAGKQHSIVACLVRLCRSQQLATSVKPANSKRAIILNTFGLSWFVCFWRNEVKSLWFPRLYMLFSLSSWTVQTSFSPSVQGKDRIVSTFLSRRFHPKSRQLFPFNFSNITLRTDLLTFGVTCAAFKIAGEMHRLPAYFDNPGKR